MAFLNLSLLHGKFSPSLIEMSGLRHRLWHHRDLGSNSGSVVHELWLSQTSEAWGPALVSGVIN